LSKKLGQKQVEHLELLRSVDHVLPIDEGWPGFHILKQVRMVAYLLQLHEHVEKLDLFGLARFLRIYNVDVAREDVFVKLLLHLAHSYKQVNFLFGLQGVLYVQFESSKHERTEQAMDLLDDKLLLFVNLLLADVLINFEQVIKVVCRVKEFGHQKVEESP
jgi:hypothetical protein